MKASLLAAMAALLSSRSPREETEGGFTFRLRNRAPAPTGPVVIALRRQRPGAKSGPGEMGRRERQRREWRGRVDETAASLGRANARFVHYIRSNPPARLRGYGLQPLSEGLDAALAAHVAALLAPKPWRKARAT